jgi:MFS family permease
VSAERAHEPRLAILAPLRHRAYRVLWSGQVVSDLGDWLDFLALIALLVYHWDLGAAALAALSVTVAVPRIVVGPIAGVWVDRWSRRTVMVVADFARAAIVLGLVFAPDLITVLVLVFLKGVFSAAFGPARQASIRATVPEDDLLAASSLGQLSTQVGKVLGPVLGGILVAAAGPRAAFAVDSVTFVVSALLLLQLPALGKPATDEDEEESHFWTELREGISYVIHRASLSIAIGSMSAALFMIFIIDSIGVLALKQLGVNEALFGLAVASIGLGTTLGALAIGQWGRRFSPFRIMGAGQLVSGAAIGVLGAAVVLSLRGTGVEWIAVYLVTGLSAAGVMVSYGYILQVETPRELMGRVFASAEGVQTVFQLVAPPLGAALAELYGVGVVFGAAGVALALVGVVVILTSPRVHVRAPAQAVA